MYMTLYYVLMQNSVMPDANHLMDGVLGGHRRKRNNLLLHLKYKKRGYLFTDQFFAQITEPAIRIRI